MRDLSPGSSLNPQTLPYIFSPLYSCKRQCVSSFGGCLPSGQGQPMTLLLLQHSVKFLFLLSLSLLFIKIQYFNKNQKLFFMCNPLMEKLGNCWMENESCLWVVLLKYRSLVTVYHKYTYTLLTMS